MHKCISPGCRINLACTIYWIYCANIFVLSVQRANFHQKMKMMKLQCFCIFMYIWWLLKFLGVFFCGKLTKPCHHARTFQLVSQQSVASINKKKPKILTKRPPVATTVPSGILHHHWGIGIPWYTFGSSIQARTIPQKPGKYYQQKPKIFNKTSVCSYHFPLRHSASSLGHWYTRIYLRIFDPGPCNSTTFSCALLPW